MTPLLALWLLTDLTGVVLDPTEAAVPGATVTLRDKGGRARSVTTDIGGVFRFEKVTAGAYRIEVRHKGLQAAAVPVTVRETTPPPVRIVLAVAALQEEVTVGTEAERVNTDPGQNLDVVRLDRRMLDELPMLDRDLISAASQFLDAGSIGSKGVSVVADGMETSEAGVSASAIEEVRINQNPYSAEFSRPGRGRIEVITKAGETNYHGALNLLLRDHRLAARNAFAARRPREQRRIFEGHLTGPLGRSRRSSFLLSGERKEQDEASLVYAVTPAGAVRDNVPTPSRETGLSVRYNRQFSHNNTLSIRYEFAGESQLASGAGGFRLPEAAADQTEREHHVYYSHRAVFTPAWIGDLFVRAGRHDEKERGRRPDLPRIVVVDAFTGGSAQTDRYRNETHVQLTATLSTFRGRHLVKTGVNIPDLSRRGSNDRDNFGGTFSFASIGDFLAGRPFAYTARQGDSRLAFWQKEIGWFLQDDVRVRSNLSIGLGLRYEWQNFLDDRNNFAPRISFAFAPGRRRRTVLRGGAGYFYDRTGSGPMADVLRYDGRRLREVAISNPAYPDPGAIAARAANLVRFAPGLRSPYTGQYSFGVERQLTRSTTLAATYAGVRGVKFFRSRDANAPLPPLYVRPDPTIGLLRQIESSAGMKAHSVTVAFRGKAGRFFDGTAQYTAGRVYDDTDGIGSFPADHYDLRGEWSRASSDERRRLRLAGAVKPAEWFNLGVIFAAGSGRPYSLTTGRDDNRDTMARDRPAGVKRNTLEGPGSATLDLRWSKEFSRDNGWSATIAVDALNALNRVNHTRVVGALSSPLFGHPAAAAPARRIQIGLRLKF